MDFSYKQGKSIDFGLAHTCKLYSIIFLDGLWSRLIIFLITLGEKNAVLMPQNKLNFSA